VQDAVEEQELGPTAAEVNARLEQEIEIRVAGAYGGDRDRWRADLEREKSSVELHRLRRGLQLLGEMRLERLQRAQRVVSEEAVRALFGQRYADPADYESAAPGLRLELEERKPSAVETREFAADLILRTPVERHPALDQEGSEPQEVVLHVGGKPVTRRQFASWLAPQIATVWSGLYVERHLLQRDLERAGLGFDEEQVRARAERQQERALAAQFGGDRERWLDDLEQRGRTPAGSMRRALLRARLDVMAETLLLEASGGDTGTARGLARQLVDATAWRILPRGFEVALESIAAR
jgi:hypothetical protein